MAAVLIRENFYVCDTVSDINIAWPEGTTYLIKSINIYYRIINGTARITYQTIRTPEITTYDGVITEELIGIRDGINAKFKVSKPFIPESVEIYANGIRQKILTDYQLLSNEEIIFTFSPSISETLIIIYKKQNP